MKRNEGVPIRRSQILFCRSSRAAHRATSPHGGVAQIIHFGVVTDPAIVHSTVDRMELLKVDSGEYRRVRSTYTDPAIYEYWYERQEFLFADFNLAELYRRLGRNDEADAMLKRIADKAATGHNLIPEMYVALQTVSRADRRSHRSVAHGRIRRGRVCPAYSGAREAGEPPLITSIGRLIGLFEIQGAGIGRDRMSRGAWCSTGSRQCARFAPLQHCPEWNCFKAVTRNAAALRGECA
ncbi:MAG TPA: hypothetical protein VMV57_13535 [Terracidiphilus sp.]|nr:hypothetical protein [Terracidiphilus sp.]